MQYISFYKDRLPFKPKSNVVIYFDVMGVGVKRYYGIINDYYDLIVREFRRGELEFCYLPNIAHDMDLEKIYHYFNPQAGPNDHIPYINLYKDSDLLEYNVKDYDQWRLSPGLIQYIKRIKKMQHLKPNTTLQGGKYKIERLLGQGGFGFIKTLK